MDDKIIALATYRLEKAKEDMETAGVNMKHNKLSQSINRSYYAIFHAVRALLAFERFDSKRHSVIIGHFNQYYVATGKIDKSYHKMLVDSFEVRTKSDYQDFYVVSIDDAERQLNNAKNFIAMIEACIQKLT
mgnify:CR=1 FL=1